MKCYKSAQVHPATTVLGHTLVRLRNKVCYEGTQVHQAFRTRAQWAHWIRECQPQNGIPRPLYGNIQLSIGTRLLDLWPSFTSAHALRLPFNRCLSFCVHVMHMPLSYGNTCAIQCSRDTCAISLLLLKITATSN